MAVDRHAGIFKFVRLTRLLGKRILAEEELCHNVTVFVFNWAIFNKQFLSFKSRLLYTRKSTAPLQKLLKISRLSLITTLKTMQKVSAV